MDARIQRSIAIINFIIRDLSLGNGKRFSEALGFKRPERIYKILRGEVAISRNLARIISDKYPKYNYDWLLTGDVDSLYVQKAAEQQALSPEMVTNIVEAIYLFEDDLMENAMFASWVASIEARTRKEVLKEFLNQRLKQE